MKAENVLTSIVYKQDEFSVNPLYTQERTGNYERRDAILIKWEFSKGDVSGCGNVNNQCYFDTKKQSFIFSDESLYMDKSFIPMYRIMSPALLLYRLIATFFGSPKCEDGYKSIWNYTIKHTESGKQLNFSEWKGAIGFWLPEYTYTKLSEQFRNDLIELLNYLVSQECAHPYDNLVAGCIA